MKTVDELMLKTQKPICIRESAIEKKVCDYAKEKGVLVYKFTSPQRRSVPDRLFVSPKGVIFFIEFKAPGKKPTEAQFREITKLRDNGAIVFVVDNVERGKTAVDKMVL